MAIKFEGKGVIPKWLEGNDWSSKQRLAWARHIMVTEKRNWVIREPSVSIRRNPDPVICALWCLLVCNTVDDALDIWWGVQS